MLNQREYLKKYLLSDEKLKKKKKKSKDKKAVKTATVKIIDDDEDYSFKNREEIDEEDLFATNQDLPVVVGIIDERPPELQAQDYRNSSKWKTMKETEDNSVKAALRRIKLENENSSPSRINRGDSDESPPRRDNKRRSSDESPPRRQQQKHRRGSDESPPRRRQVKKEESDVSPPRRRDRRRNSDSSPPRRRIERNSDASPPRRSFKREKSDESPPRRQRRRNSDESPPRRQIKREESPPRRPARRRDSDESPPRRPTDKSSSSNRNHHRNGRSPPRNSPSRHRRQRSNSNTSPPRRNSRFDSPGPSSRSTKMSKTLDGKTSGLQDARALKRENDLFKERQDRLYREMDPDMLGRNAEIVSRDRRGRKRDYEKEMEEERIKSEKEQERKKVYDRWGKGLKQVEATEVRMQEIAHEINKPLARFADDEDLQGYLKDQERLEDPMLQYMRNKKKQTDKKMGVEEKPMYQGNYPENRFGIRPGYRWDGVDRSNGYEKKFFDAKSSKKAMEEEAYRYATEDM